MCKFGCNIWLFQDFTDYMDFDLDPDTFQPIDESGLNYDYDDRYIRKVGTTTTHSTDSCCQRLENHKGANYHTNRILYSHALLL